MSYNARFEPPTITELDELACFACFETICDNECDDCTFKCWREEE